MTSLKDRGTTQIGYVNRNRQVTVRATDLPGNDHLQKIYVLRCEHCRHEYGANGSDIFQRKCPNCQQVYNDREQYLELTDRLQQQSTIYEMGEVQEYRNCSCGSTLLLVLDDRRDSSDFGHQRRILFDLCCKKLKKLEPTMETKEVKKTVRQIFRRTIQESSFIDENDGSSISKL